MNHLATALAPIGQMLNDAMDRRPVYERTETILVDAAHTAIRAHRTMGLDLDAVTIADRDAVEHALNMLASDPACAWDVLSDALVEAGEEGFAGLALLAAASSEHVAGKWTVDRCRAYVKSLLIQRIEALL